MAVKVDAQKEIIFGSSDPNVSRMLSKKEKDGVLRKVAPRIYTTNLIDSLENIVRRNLIDNGHFPRMIMNAELVHADQRQSLWNRLHGVKELSCRLQRLRRTVASKTANHLEINHRI